MDPVVRLLGDVEVYASDRRLDLGHARQRCVLVALAIDAGRTVPADRLIDRVWGERSPQRARNTLAGYVSRLRRLVAATGVGAIVRAGTGYRLEISPEEIDLHRFDALVARARAEVDGSVALARLEEALALWRGEAFATLETAWLDQVRVALDGRRFAAELDRNDLALGQDRHLTLLPGLVVAAAAHPLDERLAGQLMLALYRCGRQADALRHFQRVRAALGDELGADPGAPLRLLHRQILRNDPILTSPAAVRGAGERRDAPGRPVPSQLPPALRVVAARTEEIARLDAIADSAAVTRTTTVVAISGTAGVGKTTLAVTWAHRIAARFGDGSLYVDLRGYDPGGRPMAPADAVRGFLDALGVPPPRIPTSPDAQVGLFRSLLAGRRMLVVLDNARDTEQVRALLPGTPGSVALVTSRDRLTGLVAAEQAHVLSLDLLTRAQARELLGAWLGPARLAAEPDAVDTIVDQCARLPLALAIVAARAVERGDRSLARIAGELCEPGRHLAALAGGDSASDVRAAFSWSYRTLGADAADLFRLLGLHLGPDAPLAAVASLAGLPVDAVRPLVAELVRAHLISEPVPDRFALHDLLREYAIQLVEQEDPLELRRAAIRRMLDHYLHTAHAAALAQHPYRDPAPLPAIAAGVTVEPVRDHGVALAWFTAEQAALVAAVELAGATGADEHAWVIAWSLWTHLDRRGHWHDLHRAGRAALAAADRLGDPAALAPVHRMLARVCIQLERFDEGHEHLREALARYGEAGDTLGLANTHSNIGVLYESQHRYAEALRHAQRSLALYRAADDRRGIAYALATVGWTHALRHEYEPALDRCGTALAMQRDLGDLVGQALTLHSIGYARHHLDQHRPAIAAYEQALALFRRLDYRYFEADTLARLGDTRAAADQPDAARRDRCAALAILDELGHPDAKRVRALV